MRLAEHFGVSQSTVHRWINGADPGGRHRDAIRALFQGAEDSEDDPLVIPIIGLAGAGPDGSVVFSEGQGNFGEVDAPIGASKGTVALEVRGNSMHGLANDGWLIFYDERTEPRLEYMGEPCVCWLEDGHVLVKIPQPTREPGLFHLESANAPTMRDVPVREMAAVTDIKTKRAAGKYIRRNPDQPIDDVKTEPTTKL